MHFSLVPARIVNWIPTGFEDAGDMIKLNCEASGDAILNFTWFKDGQKISQNRIQDSSKSATSTLIFSPVTAKDGGNYLCKVFNSFGKDERAMKLTIRGKQNN